MGLVKVITQSDADYDYVINCQNYVTVNPDTRYYWAYNADPIQFFEQCMIVRSYFGKMSGNQLVHFVIVLDNRYRNITAAIKAAHKIAEFYKDRYQIIFGIHEKCMKNKHGKLRSYYHIHMIMNTVSIQDGKMFSATMTELSQFMNHIKSVTGDYKLQLKFGHGKDDSDDDDEY